MRYGLNDGIHTMTGWDPAETVGPCGHAPGDCACDVAPDPAVGGLTMTHVERDGRRHVRCEVNGVETGYAAAPPPGLGARHRAYP